MAQTHTEDGQARKQAEASGGPAGLTLGPEKTPSRNPPARGWSMHICVCVHAHSHTHSHTQVSFIYVYISYTYIFIDNFQIFKTV